MNIRIGQSRDMNASTIADTGITATVLGLDSQHQAIFRGNDGQIASLLLDTIDEKNITKRHLLMSKYELKR